MTSQSSIIYPFPGRKTRSSPTEHPLTHLKYIDPLHSNSMCHDRLQSWRLWASTMPSLSNSVKENGRNDKSSHREILNHSATGYVEPSSIRSSLRNDQRTSKTSPSCTQRESTRSFAMFLPLFRLASNKQSTTWCLSHWPRVKMMFITVFLPHWDISILYCTQGHEVTWVHKLILKWRYQ